MIAQFFQWVESLVFLVQASRMMHMVSGEDYSRKDLVKLKILQDSSPYFLTGDSRRSRQKTLVLSLRSSIRIKPTEIFNPEMRPRYDTFNRNSGSSNGEIISPKVLTSQIQANSEAPFIAHSMSQNQSK